MAVACLLLDTLNASQCLVNTFVWGGMLSSILFDSPLRQDASASQRLPYVYHRNVSNRPAREFDTGVMAHLIQVAFFQKIYMDIDLSRLKPLLLTFGAAHVEKTNTQLNVSKCQPGVKNHM